MYNLYKNQAENTIKKHNMTEDEIEAVFRYQQFQYRVEDVKCHADDLCDNESISEEARDFLYDNAEVLAERYIYKLSDCNLPENDVFEDMIMDSLRTEYEGEI